MVAEVKNNTVTMSGGEVTSLYGGSSASSDARGNNVNITDGTIKDSAYGGYVVNNGTATGNTLN